MQKPEFEVFVASTVGIQVPTADFSMYRVVGTRIGSVQGGTLPEDFDENSAEVVFIGGDSKRYEVWSLRDGNRGLVHVDWLDNSSPSATVAYEGV